MTTKCFTVCDMETTGLVAPGAEVIELGLTRLVFDTDTKAVEIRKPTSTLFRPERGIPPETSAIHHLLMRDVADQPVCTPEALKAAITGADFVVAHNLSFDGQWLTPEIIAPAKAICTRKVAARIWEDAPGHSNGVLRYWLGLDLDPADAMPPHRAGPDSFVTANILARLLETERVAHMVRWTAEPLWMRTCPLGKWRGVPWPDVDHGYLSWMTRTPDLDQDAVHWARLELQRRQEINA